MADGELTPRQHAFIAAYLGDARMNATRAAEMAGYAKPRQEGSRQLSNAVIQAEIAAWREQSKKDAIADVSYRIARLAELERKYWELIDARADDLGGEVNGGETGLLVRQEKVIGQGNNAQTITEYKADTAVTKEIREIYDDVAKELGQRVDKHEHSGPDGESLTVVLRTRPDGPQ